VSEDDLLNKEQMGLLGKMQPGERAVSVKVNAESSTGGFVQPGNKVDIACTMRGNDPSARLILQNMLVLAVDAQIQKDPNQPNIMGQTVTLAAKPDEALKLSLAASQGELRLLPRTFNDQTPLRTTVVRLDDLNKINRPTGDKREREKRDSQKDHVPTPWCVRDFSCPSCSPSAP